MEDICVLFAAVVFDGCLFREGGDCFLVIGCMGSFNLKENAENTLLAVRILGREVQAVGVRALRVAHQAIAPHHNH